VAKWCALEIAGKDPTKIVARSTDALLISELPFETCGGEKNKGRTCQVRGAFKSPCHHSSITLSSLFHQPFISLSSLFHHLKSLPIFGSQEPLVMFSTGMKPLGGDEFYVIYGAADTSVRTPGDTSIDIVCF